MNEISYLGVQDGVPHVLLNNYADVDVWDESMGFMEDRFTRFGMLVEDWPMNPPNVVITNTDNGRQWVFDYIPSALDVRFKESRTARKQA